MVNKNVGIIVMGAAIGSAQTFILREFVDKQYGPIIPQLGVWGYPSVVAGIGIGGIVTLLGVAGASGYGPVRGDAITACLAYGIPALIGGVLSALYPVTSPPRARLSQGTVVRAPSTVSTPRLIKPAPAKAVSTAPTKILA